MSDHKNKKSRLRKIVISATYKDDSTSNKSPIVELSEDDYWYLCERAGLSNKLEKEFKKFKRNVEDTYEHSYINANEDLQEKENLKSQNEYYRKVLEDLKKMALDTPMNFVDFRPVENPFPYAVYYIVNEALKKEV